ncbi:MAG TPA: sulfotransferase [Candidatus Limnocylindria bacterium]|jgi:hypothetical protein
MTDPNPRVAPDFVIVGAPKSGTSAMYAYLREHPAIYLPPRKELRYFGTDLDDGYGRPLSDANYDDHYAAIPAGAMVGTAYVWYLYSRAAAQQIAHVAPTARIIAMLRNPVDMLPALHAEHLSNGNEDIDDFADALAAEADRRAGRRIPPEAHLPQGLLYSEVPRYTEQLQRYVDAFGRERIQVAIFDDFRRDPAGVYAGVLRFLGLDPSFRPDSFAVVNPRHRVRSQRVRRFLSRPPEASRRMARMLIPRRMRQSLWSRLAASNERAVAPAPLQPAMRQRLHSMFDDEVERLSRLLDVDLSAWRDGPS